MTIQEAKQRMLFQLYHLYDEREAAGIADWVLENLTGWSRIDRVINKDLPLNTHQKFLVEKYIVELSSHKPVQYVLNEAFFGGMKFFVNENTLIPRPETEELVELVVKHAQLPENGIILDIGTGSGCIPVTLKKKIPRAKIISCDISEDALEIARKNAMDLQAEIDFKQLDFLDRNQWSELPDADVLVSNPPYIPLSDKESMDNNVVMYEPWEALFVENEKPLIFYDAISDFAQTKLLPGGKIFVETHEQYASAVADLFTAKGLKDVEVVRDMQGKERMVWGRSQN
jgi:release factor glutamine methyltransferase